MRPARRARAATNTVEGAAPAIRRPLASRVKSAAAPLARPASIALATTLLVARFMVRRT
jgi:hypothetical protein